MADWIGITSANLDSFCGETDNHTVAEALDGDDYWYHNAEVPTHEASHWFILDLGESYDITKVRGRSQNDGGDPTNVNIYISETDGDWGAAVASNITTWQDTADWVEIDTTDKRGRYVKVEITTTEAAGNLMYFGFATADTIFDVYGTLVNCTVTPSAQALTASIAVPTIKYDFKHSVTTLALAASIQSPTIKYDCNLSPSALALAAALQTPTVKVKTTVTPAALALTTSLQAPTNKYDFKHSVSALALALTLQSPTLNYDYVHSVSALALALTLQAPTIDPSQKVSPAALALVASLYAPAINYDYTHTVTALALAASIQSPTLNYDFAFSVSALALAATLQTPTPCYDYKHSVSALALALTLQAPDVLMTHSALPPLMQKMLIDPYSGGAWIWLVKIEITGQATQYIARNTEDVVYYSQTYTKGNVDISGQQYTGGCSVPSVNIRIAQDGTGTLEGIINDSNGGEDGTVTLIRTHEDFFTDSIAPLEMSYDIIKAGSDSQWVNLEIGIPNPLTQRLLADMYSSTKCSEAKPSRFKGPKCQYAGANTSCTGKYSDCYTKGNHVHWCGDLGLDGNVVRV